MPSLPFSLPSSSTGTSPKVFSVDSSGTFHENYTLTVLLGDDVFGQFVLDPGNCPQLGYRRTGAAYFCAHCGDIWARIIFTDSRGVQMPFDVERVSCERHPDAYNTAGSLLAGRLAALVEFFSGAVLRREFILHMNRR